MILTRKSNIFGNSEEAFHFSLLVLVLFKKRFWKAFSVTLQHYSRPFWSVFMVLACFFGYFRHLDKLRPCHLQFTSYQVQISQGKQAKYLRRVFKQTLVSYFLVLPQMLYYQESVLPFGSYLALLVIVFHVFRGELIMSAGFTTYTPPDPFGFVLFSFFFAGIGFITVNGLFF